MWCVYQNKEGSSFGDFMGSIVLLIPDFGPLASSISGDALVSRKWAYDWHFSWLDASLLNLDTEMSNTWWLVYTCFKKHITFLSIHLLMTSRLLPCPGYYKQCCDEHWGTRVSFNSGFHDVYAQQWDCWVVWGWRKLSAEELMLLNCGAGEDS